MLVAAAGMFRVTELQDAVRQAAVPGSWGFAWCYGNRLESIRAVAPWNDDPEFPKLVDIRTDMAVLCVNPAPSASLRNAQPYVRREGGSATAFCHQGTLTRPERLDTGGRIADSGAPSELLFLHLLGRLDSQNPVNSARAALGELAGDEDLSFCLLNASQLVVACWRDPRDATDRSTLPTSLWLGRGQLARYVSSQPLRTLPDVVWEPMANHSVFAINRTRHELV